MHYLNHSSMGGYTITPLVLSVGGCGCPVSALSAAASLYVAVVLSGQVQR